MSDDIADQMYDVPGKGPMRLADMTREDAQAVADAIKTQRDAHAYRLAQAQQLIGEHEANSEATP